MERKSSIPLMVGVVPDGAVFSIPFPKPGGVFLVKGKKFSKGGQLKNRKKGMYWLKGGLGRGVVVPSDYIYFFFLPGVSDTQT